MVLRCPEVDGPSKPPPTEATAAGPSSSVPFGNSTLRWGCTRLMRCQINSDHGDHPDRRPSSASPPPSPPPPPPPPPAPQTKNDPSPSSSRPRLVLRIPLQNRPKKPETNEPSAPTKQRDHRPKERKAPGGAAPVEIRAGSVTRSLRSRIGAELEEMKTKEEKMPKKAVFHMSLSDEEIMNDFIAMTGSRPPRCPKRRPWPIQKKLDEMFPGSDLRRTVTPARYRVSDRPGDFSLDDQPPN